MGKVSVSNITGSLGFVVVPKALAMARSSATASLLTLLPPPPSWFCPLALYCYTSLVGWYPTAPHRLAPYCYSAASTLLLIIVGWHPLCPVAPLASLQSPIVRPLGYAPMWYCTASVAASNALGRYNSPA